MASSSENDVLSVLRGMHSVLRQMQKDGTNFSGDGFGNINVNIGAVESLAKSVESVKEEVKSADQVMNEFLGSAEKAAETFKDTGKFLGAAKTSLGLLNKAANGAFSKMFEKIGIKAFAEKIIGIKRGIHGWGKALKEAKSGMKRLYVFADGLASLSSSILNSFVKVASMLPSILGSIGNIAGGIIGIGSSIVKSIVGALGSALTMVTKLSKFLFTLPIGIANRAAEIGNKLRQELVEVIGQAVENTKEMFDLASNGGDAFIKLGNIAKGSLLSFQSVGSTMTKLFGYGAQGAANMVNSISKNISDMGLFADVFAKTTTNSANSIEFITRMTKGMAMQGDDINYVVREAMKNGENYRETMTRMKEASDAASEEFGINRKLLSKNFFQLRKDIINFGHLSEPALMSVASRATQLGVEIKDLAGVFNKFGTFEDAANSAALLSQTFGMNIDALQLIRAEDPMEIVEMFRNAMHATGRSFDDLNRHEKSLMATHTGLSVESLKTVMNYRTLGKSYEDIKKIMNDQKPEERQIRAMRDMRTSMSEIQKIMSEKDFFEAFLNGMSRAIVYGTKLGKVYQKIGKNMEDFYETGLRANKKDLDRALAPFTDILENINNIFSKKELEKSSAKIIKNLGDFVSDVLSPKKCLTPSGWRAIYQKWDKNISSLFDLNSIINSSSFYGKLASQVGKIIGMLLRAFVAGGPALIKGIGDLVLNVIKFIRTGNFSVFSGKSALAKFLGFDNEECWKDFQKTFSERFADVKTYLFGGQFKKEVQEQVMKGGKLKIETKPVIENRVGLFSQIGSALSEALFGKEGKGGVFESISSGLTNMLNDVPWESIGERITSGISMAGAALGKIADALAKGLSKPLAILFGADFESRAKAVEKRIKENIEGFDEKIRNAASVTERKNLEQAKAEFMKQIPKIKKQDEEQYTKSALSSGIQLLGAHISKATAFTKGAKKRAEADIRHRRNAIRTGGEIGAAGGGGLLAAKLQVEAKRKTASTTPEGKFSQELQDKYDNSKNVFYSLKRDKFSREADANKMKIIEDAVEKYMNLPRGYKPSSKYTRETLRADIFEGDMTGLDSFYPKFIHDAIKAAKDFKESSADEQAYAKHNVSYGGIQGNLDRFMSRFDQDGNSVVTDFEIENVLKQVRDDQIKSREARQGELEDLKVLITSALTAQKEFNPTMDVTLQIDGKKLTEIVTDYQSQVATDASRNTGNAVPSVSYGRSQLEQSSSSN